MPAQTSSTEPAVSVAASSHPVPLDTVSHGPLPLSRFNDQLSRIETALERLHATRTMGEDGRAAGPAVSRGKRPDTQIPASMALGGLPPTLDRIEAKIDAILGAPGGHEAGGSAAADRGVSLRRAWRSAARTVNRVADAASFEVLVEPKGQPGRQRRTPRWPGVVVLAVALTPLSLALHIVLWIALY